jgi:penicillin V acylase-like amidase (Ntn superfamily)
MKPIFLQLNHPNLPNFRPNNKTDLKTHQMIFKINYTSKSNQYYKQKYLTNTITHISLKDFLIQMKSFVTQTFTKQVIKHL